MRINIQADLKTAEKFLDKLQHRQIPFATSLALNAAAVKIQRFEKSKIRADLEDPTPQVQKSIRVKRSSKRDLQAAVFILPAIAKFLKYSIDGGSRAPRGRVEAVPVNARLNRYGNIPGRRQGKIAKLLQRPDTFVGTIRGVTGIWKRGKSKNSVSLLFAFYRSTTYRSRFPFFRYAESTLDRVWVAEFRRALARATRR